MMECHEPPLYIRAGAHLLRRSEHYPYPASVHRIEEQLLGCVRLGVMDKCDLVGGDTGFDKLRTNVVVNVESFRIGRRKVAEDQLSRALTLSRLPNLDDAGNGAINLSLRLRLGCRIDQAHVE